MFESHPGITVVSLSKTHLSLLNTGSTQEKTHPNITEQLSSQWDVKKGHNITKIITHYGIKKTLFDWDISSLLKINVLSAD